MPAHSPTNTNHQQLPEPETSSDTTSVSEIDGRVHQLALVQNTLPNGAMATLVGSIAMIIA